MADSRQNLTIAERAMEFIQDGMFVGLGSGRAATMFVDVLGAAMKDRRLRITGVPTSEQTADQARRLGIPLVTMEEVMQRGDRPLDVAMDGADEVDSQLDMIKGYGRAMVREKIVEAAAKQFIVLVGTDKLVPKLGGRGKLPIEVVPFGLALAEQRLRALGCTPDLWRRDGVIGITDNGNYILDCKVNGIDDPAQLERDILAIPGVVGTGLFIRMADIVLVGDEKSNFRLTEEMRRVRL